ncbi:HAD family hydrolase [Mycobacterium sp.]|uniref:HAD family hydrolase n=1 Tax=Mycobacterium sp. TaxID=1785 RepID=UPI002D24C86F|nr:HAD family hydrolase [Mycobacterium sp.]HZA10002.1 HAD family hydrolase [Mycobacterium sp.]
MTSSANRAPAVLFDIDGTLVDSNYLHVHTWFRAFSEVGIPVEAWRIHRSIGMDGSTLVKSLSGNADDETRQQAKNLHSRYYQQTASLLRRLPGAREVLQAIVDRGLQVVLATSAPEDELSMLRAVLGSDELVSEVTSAEDVDTAKPKPDIIEVALDRAGVTAERAVYVGDTVWDAEACTRAGVPSIGVLTGGVSRAELEKAGASMVFEDVGQVAENLATTPIAALS